MMVHSLAYSYPAYEAGGYFSNQKGDGMGSTDHFNKMIVEFVYEYNSPTMTTRVLVNGKTVVQNTTETSGAPSYDYTINNYEVYGGETKYAHTDEFPNEHNLQRLYQERYDKPWTIGQEWDSGGNASDHMKGDLYEFAVFEGEQNEYKMAQVRAYLAAKWGLENIVDSDDDGVVDASDSSPAGISVPPFF